MGGYLMYLNGKPIGDIGDFKEDADIGHALADSELRYPYDGSRTLMHAFDKFEDADLIVELLGGMYEEMPAKKPKIAK